MKLVDKKINTLYKQFSELNFLCFIFEKIFYCFNAIKIKNLFTLTKHLEM